MSAASVLPSPLGSFLLGGAASAAAGALDETRLVPAAESAVERRALADEEELYAIFVTTEALENAYIRDLLPAAAYTRECARLLRSYDLQISKLREGVAGAARFADVRSWMVVRRSSRRSVECSARARHARVFTPKCYFSLHLILRPSPLFPPSSQAVGCVAPQAYLRLERAKLPATDTHYSDEGYAGGRGAKPDALAVSETTGAIIQALDAVKLGLLEVDQITPYLAAAVESLNRHAWLPADVKAALTQWKRTVGGLRASDTLSAEQARQLLFDLESTYNNFRATLK